MRSKLIPGKIRPVSFIFVIPLIILALIFAQISFNVMVDFRLHQLESQISPVEVTESSYSEENAKEEQVFDKEIKTLETANRGSCDRNWKSLGNFEITYYCKCEKCCGLSTGITATGTVVEEGRTIATDPDVIPMGTQVLIDGILYTAEGTGGHIQGSRIDIYVSSVS